MHTSEYVYYTWKLLEFPFLPSSFNTQRDLFLQGCIKENVYAVEVQDSNDMISCILVASTEIRANLNS
jgi:hypothetical protein